MGGPWSQNAWAVVVGEAHTLERTQAPDPWRPGPPTGQEGMGYHPKLPFAAGLSSWQPLHPTICTEPASGAGPPPEAAFLHHPLLYCLAEFGTSLASARTTAVQAGAVRIKCSEGLGAQETRKCVVVVHSKGTIACS
ncbi:unnamed protein product [Rangifer tarandus platyrhynchus]|uniref:Uncharacterized protein n=2 Tax=Rangifer tarandus platyrhynchus TaxID=3082113 RepID=A0ABN8ZVE6_RANTA|nr:unnamed protein product [Rangifer tarandus platyrhynchus]